MDKLHYRLEEKCIFISLNGVNCPFKQQLQHLSKHFFFFFLIDVPVLLCMLHSARTSL